MSGPSGAGKSAICAGLAEGRDVVLSVSMTTRPPRGHEVQGKNYYFVDRETFGKVIDNGGFLEYAEVYGECYGTPRKPVAEQLEKGKSVILEIDVNGAMQIRENAPDAVLVFIMPPSADELRRRIEDRGTETPERIAHRLEQAESEISQLEKYDYCVVNDDLKRATKDVLTIMHAQRQLGAAPWEGMLGLWDTGVVRQIEKLLVGDNAEKIIGRYHKET